MTPLPRRDNGPVPTDSDIWAALLHTPKNEFDSELHQASILELYKMMVTSSEALVGRRQGVNTFFLTVTGALLTGMGLILQNPSTPRQTSLAILALAATGGILAYAWRSLIISFGQLNAGKFAVISRLEGLLPIAIYNAEWTALAEGKNATIYRSFTSREKWAPLASMVIYGVIAIVCLAVASGFWTPN